MEETVILTFAVLLRIVSNPFSNVIQKQLTAKGNHPLLINFLSYFLLSIVCIFIAGFLDWPVLSTQFWTFSILGGIAGALGNSFLIKALHLGDLSVLGPINAYKSLVGIFMGVILLGEVPNFWGIAGVVLIILGSYFVLESTPEKFSFALLKKKEIQFRILAMILTAIEAVFVKKVIIASTTPIAFMSWCFFGAVFSFILLIFYRLDIKKEYRKIEVRNFKYFALLIFCIGTMQITTNYVFENMAVGYGLSLFQLSLILSVLLGHRIFKEKDIRKKLIGSFIMIIGSLLIILLKDD